MKRVLVAGAGGFIGHHLAAFLKEKGYHVRGVDLKRPEFEETHCDEFELLDLREPGNCLKAASGVEEVYQLAADMGGIGYITANHAIVLRNNTLINTHMLEAARESGVSGYLFTSSACVYPQRLQKDVRVKKLKEEDAYPAEAEPGYGWEKLFAELACRYYREDYGLKTHIVRFHSMFGPLGTYEGGREKSPAAICRKVALAGDGDEIEVWGDGRQTRSFCYVSDTVEGIYALMRSGHPGPVNLGQDRLVTIDEVVDIVAGIAGKKIKKRHDTTKPQGVRGRNADVALAKMALGWESRVSLEEGLERTYRWIRGELVKAGRIKDESQYCNRSI